jgi:heme-degrading monooxygenase HmoA
MFITICTFRARAGAEDAIIAMHEDRGRSLRPRSPGYRPGELLHHRQDPQVFLPIARYGSEAEPACAAYHSAWCDV